MTCGVFNSEGATEGLIGGFTDHLNMLSNQIGKGLIGVIHKPPEFGPLKSGIIFCLTQSKDSSMAHRLLELYKIRLLSIHNQTEFLSVECPCLLDIGYMQHNEIQSYQHMNVPFLVTVLVKIYPYKHSIADRSDSIMSVAK